MAATPFQGHAADSASKAAFDNADDVAPADAPGYDPSLFGDQPGAGARASGFPRHDGQSGAINAGGTIANGSARKG